MEITNILTPSGNLKSEAHKAIRKQFTDAISDYMGLDATPNGDLAKVAAHAVAEDGSLIPVYVRFEVVVTTVDPFVKKGKDKVEKKEVSIPDLVY